MKKLLLILPMLFLIACEGEEQLAQEDTPKQIPTIMPSDDPGQLPEGALEILSITIPDDPACNQEGYDLSVLDHAVFIYDKQRVDFFVMDQNNNQAVETLEVNISGDTVEFVHEFLHDQGYFTSMSIYGILNEAQGLINVDLGCGTPLVLTVD